jgi:hypothetical protein
MSRENLKVELELLTAEEVTEQTKLTKLSLKYYLKIKNSFFIVSCGDTAEEFTKEFQDFARQEIAKIEALKWQPKEGDWARDIEGELVQVASMIELEDDHHNAIVKWQNGDMSKALYRLYPGGDWRVGDVLEDGEGDIVQITDVHLNNKITSRSLKNGWSSTFNPSADYAKTLKPCFRPKPEAKPDHIAEVKKMVIDGLNEIVKKIEEVQ